MERIWWEQITNANRFIDLIVSGILEGKSSVLCLHKLTPWRNTMRELVENRVLKDSNARSFELIGSPESSIGEFMLNKYCKEEKRLEYRPSKSYAQFLAESDDIVLNSRIVWVQNISSKKLGEWVDFVSEYHLSMKSDMSPAVFILEADEDLVGKITKKGVRTIVYTKEMNYFDTYAFCILAASGVSGQDYLKNYWAELLSSVCAIDIELSAKCMGHAQKFLENPYEVLCDIAESETRSDGEPFSFSLDKDYVAKKIWKTQIKIIFPVIEDYREEFVNKYREQIMTLLPIKNSQGEDLNEPEEIEIGTLYHIASKCKLVVDSNTHNELYRLKTARNTLAHLELLNLEIVKDVLGKAKFIQDGWY